MTEPTSRGMPGRVTLDIAPASAVGTGGAGLIPEWQFNGVLGSPAAGGTRLTHIECGAELWVREDRLVAGRGYRAASPRSRRELARVGAILRLRARRRYHLHAAGAVDAAGRAWLLAGPTGSGKSTLAYALARAGWRILGDDGVIVELPTGGGALAHPWREPLRVCATLAPAFAELRAIAWDRVAIPGDARRRAEVPAPAASVAPIAGIVWLTQGPHDRLSPMRGADALIELVRGSAWVLITDDASRQHLEALRRLATDVPSFRLVHSPAQLHAIASTIASIRL